MEDLIPLLIFLFFILAPIIEKILKAGKKDQEPPPPQRQRPRPTQQQAPKPYQRRAETAPEPAPRSESESGSAADMLPEDLWAILTGEAPRQRRPVEAPPAEPPAPVELPRAPAPRRPPPPRPAPPKPRREPLPSQQRKAPAPDRDATAVGEERFGVRADPAGDRPARVDYTPEDYRRPVPRHEEPVVVSMETLPEHDEVRHSKFHDRLAALAAPSVVDRGKARVDVGLHDPAALRRAIIVAEILGTPKGME